MCHQWQDFASRLKRDQRIRSAVLYILDCLVESGSWAAFRMRDDFVRPAASRGSTPPNSGLISTSMS